MKRSFTARDDGGERRGLLQSLSAEAAAIRFDELPQDIVQVAKHCVLDWLGAAIAGAREPAPELALSAITAAASGPTAGGASLIGRPGKLACLDAALVNGAASHALEIDDSIVRMQAHASVALLPGLFALAEVRGASPARVIAGLVAGVEYGCRLGDRVNPGHYARGWHASATLGCLASAAACANLLGLDARRSAAAVGFAAVQSAGLQGAFGSIAKPLQVGRASSAGVLGALLAASGGELPSRVLEGPEGFLDLYAPDAVAPKRATPAFAIRETLFKRHASCHGTHAALEAVALAQRTSRVAAGDLARVVVEVPEQLRSVCGIDEPPDGQSLRFSVRGVVTMAILGLDTADPRSFTDEAARDPRRLALQELVEVRFVPAAPGFGGEARVEIERRDGVVHAASADVTTPERDLALQGAALEAKFERVVLPVLGTDRTAYLIAAVEGFDDLPVVEALTEATSLLRA